MDKLFTFKNDPYFHVSFDLVEFLKRQEIINSKFPNPNRKKNGNIISDFDNMSGQIIEEMYEFELALMEYSNSPSDETIKNMIEEFYDALMYCGSLYIEMRESLKFDDSHLHIPNVKFSTGSFYPFKDRMFKFNSNYIAELRRMIYNRKYHKPDEAKPIDFEKEFLKQIIQNCFFKTAADNDEFSYLITPHDIMQGIINETNRYKDGNEKEALYLLNQILNKKQKFIQELPNKDNKD